MEKVPVCGGPKFYGSLFRLIRRHKPDIVHFQFIPFETLIYWFVSFLGVRKIFFTDQISCSFRPGFFRKTLRVPLLRFLTCKIRKMIAVSDFVKNWIVNSLGIPSEKVIRLYNGVNRSRFRKGDASKIIDEFAIPFPRRILLTAAWLRKEKGIHDLIAAFAEIAFECPDAILFVVGDGPERESLMNFCRDLKLDPKVIFTGYRSDVQDFMACADVFVLPSVYPEAYGNVLAEAKTAGKAVVSTRVGGIPEVIEDGVTGILVEPGDSGALAEAIRSLLGDRKLREGMGTRARASVEHYDMKEYVKKEIEIYQD